jgi:hypothetical protein
MWLLKESVLRIWKVRQASVRADLARARRTAVAFQPKLDRLDEASLFHRSDRIETSDQHPTAARGTRAAAQGPSRLGPRSGLVVSRARRQACECGSAALYRRAT